MPGDQAPPIIAKINQYLAKRSAAGVKRTAGNKKARSAREGAALRKKAAKPS